MFCANNASLARANHVAASGLSISRNSNLFASGRLLFGEQLATTPGDNGGIILKLPFLARETKQVSTMLCHLLHAALRALRYEVGRAF